MLQTIWRSYRNSWKALIILMGLALLSGCVIVPHGGYYTHPYWHRGWWRR